MKKTLPLFLILFLIYWGCEVEPEEVLTASTELTLWGEVYSVENTDTIYLNIIGLKGPMPPEIGNLTNLTYLNLGGNQLTGSIPPEIGNLTNLESLHLELNEFTGEIPESICDLNIEWSSSWSFNISKNQLCPLYPSCIEDYAGAQDTSDCP